MYGEEKVKQSDICPGKTDRGTEALYRSIEMRE